MIKFEKNWTGSYHLTLFNKIVFYAGKRSLKSPELGISIDLYDRSFTINLVWIYFGLEIYHSE